MKKIKESPLLKVVLFILCWNIVLFPILYFSARHRASRVLNPYIQEVKDSVVINNEFGIVKNIRIKHFFNYTKRSVGHTCVDMKITTDNGEYIICKIIENKFQGYIYNKKLYEEKTCSSIIEIENYNNDFDSQLNTYLNEINNYPKTREPIIYKIENNRYKIVNICKYQKEEKCNETNEKYLNNLINAFKDRYRIRIVEE